MIKILSLFSGYGGSEFSLKKAGIPFECIGYSDIEKCANYIYDLNHGGNALGDVTKIDEKDLPDFDLITAGFPCQSFSIAGKREGFEALNKGKLFFEIIRIAKYKKPRYMLLENVQGILSHDNGKTFEIVLSELRRIGYWVKWELLFSKEHGTPQNRPRLWFACFREKEDYDKFMFPQKEELKITVKDLLEDNVDEKYYLNENQLRRFNDSTRYGNHKLEYNDTVSPTLVSMGKSDVSIIPCDYKIHSGTQSHRSIRNDGICPTIMCGMKMILENDFKVADFRYDEGVRLRENGISPTLTSTQKSGTGLSGMPIINTITTGYDRQESSKEFIAINQQLNQSTNQWRRLTPRECFRLQGFFNDEIKFGNLSDSKLYFLAGNGWDINVASKIFIQMFKGNQNKQNNLSQFGL